MARTFKAIYLYLMLKMQRLSLPAEEAENTGGKEEATEPQAQ